MQFQECGIQLEGGRDVVVPANLRDRVSCLLIGEGIANNWYSPSDAIICNGNWNYNQAKYYSNDAKGLVVVEPSVDIACTLMSG